MLKFGETKAETLSGLLMHRMERVLTTGDRIEFDGFSAEVLETRDDRALRVLVSREQASEPPDETVASSE